MMKLRSKTYGSPQSGLLIHRPLKRYKILSSVLMIMAVSIWVMTIGVYAEDIGRSSDTTTMGVGVPACEPQNISHSEAIAEIEPEYESGNESVDIKSIEQSEEDRINSFMIFGSTILLILTPFIVQASNHPYFISRRKLTC